MICTAFTEPVSAHRFRGFLRVLPADESYPEVLRFLSPSDDASVLEARFA